MSNSDLKMRKYAGTIRCGERDDEYFPEAQRGNKELIAWFLKDIIEEQEWDDKISVLTCLIP